MGTQFGRWFLELYVCFGPGVACLFLSCLCLCFCLWLRLSLYLPVSVFVFVCLCLFLSLSEQFKSPIVYWHFHRYFPMLNGIGQNNEKNDGEQHGGRKLTGKLANWQTDKLDRLTWGTDKLDSQLMDNLQRRLGRWGQLPDWKLTGDRIWRLDLIRVR